VKRAVDADAPIACLMTPASDNRKAGRPGDASVLASTVHHHPTCPLDWIEMIEQSMAILFPIDPGYAIRGLAG